MSEFVIAEHTLGEELGGGGFGKVWKARGPHGEVAIKVLHAELIRSSDALGRFQREQEAIARLTHRNVVKSYGHGVLDDGRPYLILELLRGPTLEDVIAKRHGLPIAEVAAILKPIGEALDHAHRNNIIHRDVKAGNVILAEDEAGPRPVLLDFGLAKLINTADEPGLTNSRAMVGTPSAMSPEQLRGTSVDARTDVYSTGLLTYHMLTGARPFAGVPAVAQGYLLLHGPRPRPSEVAPLDPAVDAVVMQAMAIEAADRFASVGELVEAFTRAALPRRPSGEAAPAMAVCIEISTQDAAMRERCSVVLLEGLRALGFSIAVEAPDSMIAGRPDVEVSVAKELEALVTAQCARADVRIAIGISTATFTGGAVDGDLLDIENWAPYPLVERVWIDPRLR
ncbi:MAG: serine/threonine-protein kinase [Kofleriaceae bacterium]